MVDVKKIKALMALNGHTQKSVVAEMNKRGVKISENTFSSKMTGKSRFDCEDADVLCDIFHIEDSAERAEIFLA